jgi:cysteine desulfurase
MVALLAIIIVLLIILFYFYFREKQETNVFERYTYLDNNSTTPLHPDVKRRMESSMYLGNASSGYAHEAKKIISETTAEILTALKLEGSKNTVIYTSCASESNNLFFRSLVDFYHLHKDGNLPHILISSIEHKTSIDCIHQLLALGSIEATFIDPKPDGTIDPMEVAYAIKDNTICISVMHVNNETGAINDIYKISQIAKSRGIPLHVDIVQSFGKLPIDVIGDVAFSISFHKLRGPSGVGALVMSNSIASKIRETPQICGTQNNNLRGGTENISGIAGAGESIKIAEDRKAQKMLHLKNMLVSFLVKHFEIQKYTDYVGKPESYDPFPVPTGKFAVVFLGPTNAAGLPDNSRVSPNTLCLSFINIAPLSNHFCNIAFKQRLLQENIIVSIGSACNKSSPSHVLMAMKAPYIIRSGMIRISLGDQNDENDIKKICDCLYKLLKKSTSR